MKSVVTRREKFIWNMIGSMVCALASLILAMVVNRIVGESLGGVFALAYSNAQLMYTIGTFEIRPLQSTDINEKISFTSYYSFRIISCIMMMVINLGYILFTGSTGTKAAVIFIVCSYKMIEAFTDVFAGFFQQKDRIDLSGKTVALRTFLSALAFTIALYLSKDLVIASIIMLVVSILTMVFYDFRLCRNFHEVSYKINMDGIKSLIIEALPLFISAFILMYINNAPKYAIDSMYTNKVQNKFNILFMPAFVINLFSFFVFRPVLTDLAKYWEKNEMAQFKQYIKKMIMIILGLTVICLAGAYVLGIPVLSALYSVDLKGYRNELLIVMITGCGSALVTFFYNIITVMRKQKFLLIGYGSSFLITLFLPRILVRKYEIAGAAISCAVSLFELAFVFFIIIVYNIRKRRKEVVQ